MKIAILSANLGEFDTPVDPVEQELKNTNHSYTFHRFTDEDFPPVAGLTPRFQYRIPKFFGWQMFPGYDYYLWLDSSMSLTHPHALAYFLNRCFGKDMVVFNHPWRNSINEEAQHIQEHLDKGKSYITSRYKNGFHMEQLKDIELDTDYVDDHLYFSGAFIYRDSEPVRDALRMCWLHQSRYWTCDQLAFTYALRDLDMVELTEDPFKSENLSLVSHHK